MEDPPEERTGQPTPAEVGQPTPPRFEDAPPAEAARPVAGPDPELDRPPAPPPVEPKQWKWIPTLLVFIVIAGITLGGFFVLGALEPTDERESVVVGPLTVHPPDGWEVAEELTNPVEGKRLTNGTGYADVFAGGFMGDPAALYAEYMRILSESAAAGRESERFRFREEPEPFEGPAGLRGVRGFYFGTFEGLSAPIEGEVFAFVGSQGEGLIFDGWASEGQYDRIQEDIVEIVNTAELAAPEGGVPGG